MGFISELVDLLGKLNFFATVHEWEQGLYLRAGTVIPRRISSKYLGEHSDRPETPKKEEGREQVLQEEKRAGTGTPYQKTELEKIVEEEQKVFEELGGLRAFLPFRRPKLPKGYVRSFYTGLPLSQKRFSKILQPGIYFFLPVIETVYVDSKQEKILNLKSIVIPVIDSQERAILCSCNIRYQVRDLYRAYTAVHDYEASLKDHTLSILARHSMKHDTRYWIEQPAEENGHSTIENLERNTEVDLRKIVAERWGLRIFKVYMTDIASVTVSRMFHDGIPGIVLDKQTCQESS